MMEEGKDCQAEGEVGDMEEEGSDKVALHFIDCIVQDEQKADANAVLSCLEAAMHALKNRFPYLTKIIRIAPYRTASIPAIPGISTFYATQYVTVAGEQQMWMFDCLGQKVPSLCVPIVSCHASSMISPMGKEGINFTGVTVTLNSDGYDVCKQVRKERRRYRKRCLSIMSNVLGVLRGAHLYTAGYA